MTKNMIIGLGTGRCGTVSLANLLNVNNLNVVHELRPLLSWYDGDYKQKINTLREQKLDGEVASYFLPYVRGINDMVENVKFICLKREKQQVIDSFMKKTPVTNHWCEYTEGGEWKKDKEWYECFPKYNISDKKEAISMYWESYYKEAETLSNDMDNFKIFETRDLNDEKGVYDILDFCGIDDKKIKTNIKLNKGKV